MKGGLSFKLTLTKFSPSQPNPIIDLCKRNNNKEESISIKLKRKSQIITTTSKRLSHFKWRI